MRLFIYGINFAPELTGIGRYTGELAFWLAARGHQVTVLAAPPYYPHWRVAPAYRGRGWWREKLHGVEVLRAPLYVPRQVRGATRILHELSFGLSCLRWLPAIFSRPWDLALAICPPLLTGPPVLALARRHGIPWVFHYQDLQVDAARELGILKNPHLFAALEHLETSLVRRAAAVTTISASMATRLAQKEAPPDRLHVLPNWADLTGIQPLPADNPFRRRLGFTPADTLILYAGNLGEKQGLEIIIECAFRDRSQANLHYLIAGAGAAQSRLKSLAHAQKLDNMHFLSVQSEQDFPWLLAAGDIHLVIQKAGAADLVMPSKLANIMAASRPFIATAAPGSELARLTQGTGAGLLIPPEDPAALFAAISELAAHPPARHAMGQRGRDYAAAHLGREVILPRWEDLFLRLAGSQA